MNKSTLLLETKIKAFCDSLLVMNNEVQDLDKFYFSSGASTLVSALSENGTPATVSTALTKSEVVGGITLTEALIAFFNDSAVSTSDYISLANNLIHGNDPAVSVVSADVEQVGIRLKALGENCVELNKQSIDIIKLYNQSELSAVIGSLSASSIIFGCSTSQAKMLAGIVLVQEFQDMMGNASVSTGDYLSTVSAWAQDI